MFESYANVNPCGGKIKLGNRVMVGEYVIITKQGVNIDEDVLFASHLSIIANEHIYKNPDIPIWRQGST